MINFLKSKLKAVPCHEFRAFEKKLKVLIVFFWDKSNVPIENI